MATMTDFITYREVREVTVRLPRDDEEAERMWGEEEVSVKAISREEIGRTHEIDYVLYTDMEAGLYFVEADGVRVFESRSHDACIEHAASLGDDVTGVFRYGDLEDPEKSWRVFAEYGTDKAAREESA